MSVRSHLATGVGRLARAASRTLGRGSGGMIGGEVALAVSPRVLADLARGSVRASLMPDELRRATLADIDAWLAAPPPSLAAP